MTQIDTLSAQVASSRVLSPDAKVFIPQQCKSATAAVLVPKDTSIIAQSFETIPDASSKHPNRMAGSFTALGMHTGASPMLTNGDVGNWHVANQMTDNKGYFVKGNRNGKMDKSHRPLQKQMDEYMYMPAGVSITAPQPTPILYNRVNYSPTASSSYVYISYPPNANSAYNFALGPPPPPPPPPLPPAQLSQSATVHGPLPQPRNQAPVPALHNNPYGMEAALMSSNYPKNSPVKVYTPNLQNYEEWPEMKSTKNAQSSKKVNHGTQKEKTKLNSKGHFKNEASQKTVKLAEIAVQTDFSAELENLTLSERPSSLFSFNKTRIRSHSNQWISNLTDSEEKDSDSGYSSPLHRRNVVSNGTHVAPERLVPNTKQPPPPPAIATTPTTTTTTTPPPPPPPPTTTQPTSFSYAAIAQRPAKSTLRNDYPVGGAVAIPSVECSTSDNKNLEPKSVEEVGKKRQKQNRRKKKKDRDVSKGSNFSSPGQTPRSGLSNSVSMDDMVIQDEDFCELPSNKEPVASSAPRMKYCDILKNNTVIYESTLNDGNADAGSGNKKDGHLTRRWQKRQELANRAAEEELAEISLEQQMLIQRNIPKKKSASGTPRSVTPTSTSKAGKAVGSISNSGRLSVAPNEVIHHAVAPGKKSKQPISLDISAMIDALEKRFKEPQQKKEVFKEKSVNKPIVGNILDSSAPAKRGKEREITKAKKPSPLKKVILKEREEKKRLRLLEVDPTVSALDNDLASPSVPVGLGVVNAESDLSQDAASMKGDHGGATTPASADLSPVSQTSPISISPLSSGVNSPIAGATEKDVNPAVLKIHSRRFREYCNQILDKDIDACCTMLLRDLVSFQDRLYHKDPIKAKMRRRIVLGLREVTKHLKLKKLKCVIISPNLEKIQSKGGLDDALNNILNLCTDQNVPFVFALGRRALGRACAKLVPVSVVGIFNYEGSEENFRKLMELTEKARQSYVEMVAMIEKDIQENVPQIYSNPTQIFAHMGHSRTPSGCSGISFASSILSEPISENYPQLEPETDSRGNEIAKKEKDSEMKISPLCFHQITASSAMAEIDDGNEADTEDSNDTACARIGNGNLELLSSGFEQCDSENDDDGLSNNFTLLQEALNVLPHIDSIHSVGYELNTEILSQHSVRTVGDTSEVLSTHSSKTIGEGSSTIVTETYSEQGHLDKTTSCADSSINLTRVKAVEKDKLIQDWVKASQCCLEEGGSSDQETAKEDSCESSGSSKDSTVLPTLSSSPSATLLKMSSNLSLETVASASSTTLTTSNPPSKTVPNETSNTVVSPADGTVQISNFF
ncbi:selenocysteine insertion sequence-binding protein 2-like isoform X1 [Octopus bimaculoides]|uniref:Ribosomal protein eL8/eL30/eS12/Gadd45 domain-containing protein n=2 Tax=Octopus bimaculoides TaxID=37653 RepID=A0A0L8GMH2_OCTBM|nr:selenocysteine insertion sequence-binding protein 2-like isoform X1 [Octopus bimaculoides]|eukprot:XP_014779717.1 PREDICTED: selenocysteine insertion sequence-binding protein 2-like [Octopus bimaculoides]